MKTKEYDARAIANYLLDLGDRENISLTNLHLQKVIFFSHGNYLKKFGQSLVANRFEAWEHGPVIPELYHALKQFQDSRIIGRAKIFDLISQQSVEVKDDFPEAVSQFLAESLSFFGRMNPWELVKLSHAPGGAWDLTIRQAEQRANFAMVIRPETIFSCFVGTRQSNLH